MTGPKGRGAAPSPAPSRLAGSLSPCSAHSSLTSPVLPPDDGKRGAQQGRRLLTRCGPRNSVASCCFTYQTRMSSPHLLSFPSLGGSFSKDRLSVLLSGKSFSAVPDSHHALPSLEIYRSKSQEEPGVRHHQGPRVQHQQGAMKVLSRSRDPGRCEEFRAGGSRADGTVRQL